MKINRRDWVRAGALAGAGALVSGCNRMVYNATGPEAPKSVSLPKGDVEPTVRLVNRVSFGPTPGELERVASLGHEKYVDEQLHTDGADSLKLQLRLHGNAALHVRPPELRDYKQSEVMKQLEQAALLRAVYSPHQLYERMVDFWSNHFNIYARKGPEVYFLPTDQLKTIRAHALGRFSDLLRASAHSPAMLCYLDNQVNRKGVPNENYAREIMELHTLGVHGGYTHEDIVEVARCFTGWGVENRFFRPRHTFRFDPDVHDYGKKVVLGDVIPASKPGMMQYNDKRLPAGQLDGEFVLSGLAVHPATGKFISGKLCRYFLGDANSPMRDKLATIFSETGGDIKKMLRPLLLSKELQSGPPILKRPFDFVVSSLRAVNANTDGGKNVQSHLAKMGQPLYMWPMPDGYPDKTTAWTGSILARWNYAFALATGSIAGTAVNLPTLVSAANATTDSECADALMALVLARRATTEPLKNLQEKVTQHIAKAPRRNDRPVLSETAALLISSPEFQWR